MLIKEKIPSGNATTLDLIYKSEDALRGGFGILSYPDSGAPYPA